MGDDEDHAGDNAANHNDGLKHLDPHHAAHTSATCVEPHYSTGNKRIDVERYAEYIEQKSLQHHAHNIYAQRCRYDFREEEEPGSCAVCRNAEAVVEIFVQRYHAIAVVKRHEKKGYDHIADEEASRSLQIGVAVGKHRARYRDVAHTRHSRANHSYGGYDTVCRAATRKEAYIGGFAHRIARHAEQ